MNAVPVVAAAPGMLHDRTRAWAQAHGAQIRVLDADSEAYFRLLHSLWTEPGDFIVVEHDMLPAPGVIGAMAACARPWCSSPYWISTMWLTEGLGCVRLAARLKERHPDLMDRLGQVTGDGMPARDWHRLDTRLARLLLDLGYRPHAHRRSLHLHDYARNP